MSVPTVVPDTAATSQPPISHNFLASAQDVSNSVPSAHPPHPSHASSPDTLDSTETDDLSIYSSENGVRENSTTFLVGDWEDDQSMSLNNSEPPSANPPSSTSVMFSVSPSSEQGDPEPSHLIPSLDTTPLLVNSREPPPSVHDDPHKVYPPPTYPPTMSWQSRPERDSITSFVSVSSYTRKMRPESTLLQPPDGPIILGIALVDFNHLEGPKIEFSSGDVIENEEVRNILPFLALPDGAHLNIEDYSYFHLVPSSPNPTTVFGISCNRQIASSSLLVKGQDVTRSTVQKAVVVLASKPVFGPIRDKLGVVTRALFDQRDFTEKDILEDFGASLEPSLRTQLTESGLYMGTSLRELVHTFRQRTLILVKALMLQKRIMFYGHPVERLCTYQYSLISLLPGLLQTLDDCGSPSLASRAPTLTRPTSLRTSDRKSMLAYLGLPLDVFGKDAFFQPYLPLQQLDLIKETKGWLCGSTNSIVTQQKDIDLLVNTETGTLEFRDPKLERSAGLTAADRKWMDDIVRDVNDRWIESEPTRPTAMHFKGSDDYLRAKFEEYVSAALASVKYQDFITKGEKSGVMITGGTGGDVNSTEDFNPLWIHEFKKTNAYDVWESTTDPLLFDIVEPRHPCNEKPSVVADIGLRIQEGIQELKLDQQLAPTREALTRSFNLGSTNFLKAMEGVGRWTRNAAASSASFNELVKGSRPTISRPSTPPVDITRADAEWDNQVEVPATKPTVSGLRQLSLSTSPSLSSMPVVEARPTTAFSTWGGIGSLWSAQTGKLTFLPVGKTVDADPGSDVVSSSALEHRS